MSDDEIKGKVTQIKGKGKEEIGKLTDDKSTQVSGKVDQVKGKAQEEIGKVKRKA